MPAVYVNAVADILRKIDAGMEKHWMKMNDSAHILYTLGSRAEGNEIETYKARHRDIQAAIMAYVARDIHNLSSHGGHHHPQPTHDHAAGYAGSFIGSIAGLQVSRASGISKNAMPIPAAHEDEGRKSKKKKKKKKKSKAAGEVSSSSCSSTEEGGSGNEDPNASDIGSSVSKSSRRRFATPTIAHGLKPNVLGHNSTMSEVKDFKEAYDAYFRTSNMHLLGANQQKAYLFKVLDKSLRQYVRNSCAPYGNTPILTFSQNNKTCLMDFIDHLRADSVNPNEYILLNNCLYCNL